jgi:phosphate transport system substrate-binding protein
MSKYLRSLVFAFLIGAMFLTACSTPITQITTTSAATTVEPTAKPTMAPGSVPVNGAGATFPQPIYSEWIYAYNYIDPSVVINYQGIGSGGGKKGILDNTLDFAGSDSLVTDAEYTQGVDLQMYPVVAGAVVSIYNVKLATGDMAAADVAKLPTIILGRQTLVDIYNAKITKWNDPAIVALNPDLAKYLPDENITAVHRSDGSGTTEIFTKALTAFSPDWTAGGASAIEWPVDKAGNGIGGKGNAGVAAAILNTPNSIGYVELSYALSNKITFVRMVNKAGKTVTADAAGLASAMNDFSDKFSDKLTNTIVDGTGEATWPIAGYTYLVLHTTTMKDCVKAQKILEFFKWALTDTSAAKRASELGYSVLPEKVRDLVLAKFGEVTCSNAKVLP